MCLFLMRTAMRPMQPMQEGRSISRLLEVFVSAREKVVFQEEAKALNSIHQTESGFSVQPQKRSLLSGCKSLALL